MIETSEAAWQEMFRDLRIEPLELWYEEIVAAPEETVRRIARHLAVEIVPAAGVAVPPIAKQAETDAREWRERYTRAN